MWLFKYLYGVYVNYIHGVLLQKINMRKLGELDTVVGPVKGLTVIVTGPTAGIGKETAASLVRRGAHVVLACRSVSKGEQLKQALVQEAQACGTAQPQVEVQVLDLASLASVRAFATAWQGRPLHILINNAGLFGLGAPREETADGIELHMGTNHLSHFLLTLMLLPSLTLGAASRRDAGARVVHVASSMHLLVPGIQPGNPELKRQYNSEAAYAQSKLAQIMFSRELRRRLPADSGITSLAVHPGMVASDIVRHLPGPILWLYRAVMGAILLTTQQGARATLYAASSPEAPQKGAASEGYFDSNCTPRMPGPAALDDLSCCWLWRWSSERVALEPRYDLPAVSK